MTKSVNETLSNEEHAYIKDAKGHLTWRQFFIRGADLIKRYGEKDG